MAKKGQVFQKYSKELKAEIMEKYFKELTPISWLAKEYEISRNTIKNWVNKTRKGKDVSIDHRKDNFGRPKKNYEDIDYKERYEILKKYQAFLKAQREKR